LVDHKRHARFEIEVVSSLMQAGHLTHRWSGHPGLPDRSRFALDNSKLFCHAALCHELGFFMLADLHLFLFADLRFRRSSMQHGGPAKPAQQTQKTNQTTNFSAKKAVWIGGHERLSLKPNSEDTV
ncbi:hypothetical protein, partial [Rhodoferax sp.]|uniref:hypothetical protein n=1 Tax=Rhodoferax sp. TaxID=50421 RepID=UPI003BB66E8B